MKKLSDFTNQYSLSKTLRFKLVPVGNTYQNFIESGILEEDNHRAESYKKVKKIIDEYHKAYIDMALSDFRLKMASEGRNNSLEEYFTLYNIKRKNDKELDLFKKVQASLRKQIVTRLKDNDRFKRIDKKELIEQDLMEFVADMPDAEDKKRLISEFKSFTVYFTGFHENRKNMYSDEEKSTAIAYRLINENLPKFVDNMNVFAVIRNSDIADKFDDIYGQYEKYLQVHSLSGMFSLDYYDIVLVQKHIDVYNAVVGQLNQQVNLYNQQHKDARLPKFKILFKQILSDREKLSWLPDEFADDRELLSAINEFYSVLEDCVLNEGALKLLLENIGSYNIEGIFIKNDLQLTEISQRATGSWALLPSVIKKCMEHDVPRKKKECEEDYQSRVDKVFRNRGSFSLGHIDECLKMCGHEISLVDYFMSLGAVNSDTVQKVNCFARINNAFADVSELLSAGAGTDRYRLQQNADAVNKIKFLLDSVRELLLFVKPLLGAGDEVGKDERFYGEFTPLWQMLDGVTPLYNKVRNYLTKKPYSQEKIKLNFQNPILLNGWDSNKETDYTSVILRRDGLYYLAIMRRDARKVFESFPHSEDTGCYEKMEYKLLPGPNKMLPKVFFSKSRIDEFKPSVSLLEKYEKGTHKKGDNFNLDDCHALIDFFKNSINKHEDWREFGFNFSATSSYSDLSGFYREVESQGYKVSFRNIPASYIDKLVEDGKIFMFQIYNKDFSPCSKGTPNLHTLYWKMLFDENNLADVVYRLNGGAEVFFRKASIKVSKPTHPANVPISNKSADARTATRTLCYDLVKDKRYTVDQFQLHVPITINFKAEGNGNINSSVNGYLKENNDMHVIGIDRGERHLLYVVVADMNGKICEQFSLNRIVSSYTTADHETVEHETDYHALLDRKEKERQEARHSWQSIENIKELKEGYLSQVVHKISELMVKYNAIVVLEDLNTGFMRGRQKVEKSVYQKFEKMLIDKLNYLVFKKRNLEEPGGLMHAYQLTNKFESFSKMGKQNGFLFYIPAWNTSKIDPLTGFVNMLDTRYESIEKTKAFFGKFDLIRYNAEKEWFEFSFDYSSFGNKAEGTRTKWTLCTYGTRIRTFRNKEKNMQWDNEEIDLTGCFKKLFAENGIEINSNLKEAICSFNGTGKEFFENLMGLLKLTLQMRNSVTGTETDYLISPVADAEGRFYDSRNAGRTMPENADANGAYNIARKGIMLIRRIKETEDMKKINLAISNREWLYYAQSNPCSID